MNQEIEIPENQTGQWYIDNVLTKQEKEWYLANFQAAKREGFDLETQLSDIQTFDSFMYGSFNFENSKYPEVEDKHNFWATLANRETYTIINNDNFLIEIV
jgi:hypothetical protein